MDAGDAPDAKKQKVGESFHRVRKDTFVEAMLTGVSTTLASDAEYGYNSANRIRRRVEDITSAIDESGRAANSISSSRAVLESRFALGADDSQYLSQCVSLLWAGDGGEKLRIAPLASMPEIMRVASARGIVRAMGGIVKRQRKDAQGRIKRALRIAGWLLQVKVVRDAILCILDHECAGGVPSQTASKVIKTAFETQGMQAGTAAVVSIGDDHGMECARSVIFAFLMLTNPESMANDVVNQLVDAMNDVVVKTESNLAQLFNTADAMDGARDRVYTRELPASLPYTRMVDNPGLQHADACHVDSLSALGQGVYPDFKQFATAVSESVGRIAGRFTSPNIEQDHPGFSTVANPQDDRDLPDRGGLPPDGKAWYFDHTLSPMWKDKRADEWTNALGVGYYQPFGDMQGQPERPQQLDQRKNNLQASRDMRDVVAAHNRHRETYHSGNIKQFGSTLLDGRVASNEGFVQFCMIRGICGFRGIHQASRGAQDEVVQYDYPETDLPQYSRGEFASLQELPLPSDIFQSVKDCEQEIYVTENMQLDTDFFANATKDVRPEMPLFAMDGSRSNKFDKARRAEWLPMDHNRDSAKQLNTETFSQSVCEASVYEFMTLSLTKPNVPNGDQGRKDLMQAAAAVAKLRQVHLNAVVKSTPPGNMMHSVSEMGKEIYVTRPCSQCSENGAVFDSKNLLLPVDAGVACFKQFENATAPLQIPMPTADDRAKNEHPYFMAVSIDTAVPNASMSAFLSNGMQIGWEDPPGDQTQNAGRLARPSEPYGLFIGASACAEPFNDTDSYPYGMDRQNNKIDSDDLSPNTLFKTFVHATLAFDQIEQIDCEEDYVKRFQNEGSKDSQDVFGIHRGIEDASRDRRADIWTDALREVAISGDRLYRFVTELTGAIGEAADSAIAWEDEDLKAVSKEASNRQKAMAERVSRFQTKLVETVVSSTLKASKLQLDVRNNAGSELVVINTDVKDGIRQITSGEAGHGFFEASVELNHLLGSASQPITIKQLVNRLQNVSMEFQEQLKDSVAASTPASFSRISEPRNSFMLHLKPDTIAAVHKAFDLITSELRTCPGYHRHVYLWEYVEGKDWVLSSRFAELVGLMLQNTRMRSGSFAAYVGTSQIITNTQNVRMQIQRLKTQVCSYIMHTDTPHFLSPTGRTLYFGGAISQTPVDAERRGARKASAEGTAPFGGDSGGSWWIWSSLAKLSPSEFDARDSIMSRISDISQRIQKGEVRADTVLMSSGDVMHAQANPRRKRAYFNGATQGQINSSAYRWCMQELLAFEGGLTSENIHHIAQADAKLAFENATTSPLTGAPISRNADTCSSCLNKWQDTWVAEACSQYTKASARQIDAVMCKFRLPTPKDITLQGVKRRCYVVDFAATGDMLRGITVDKNMHRNGAFLAHVRTTLNRLFAFDVESGFNWEPHPMWSSFLQGPHRHVWVRQVSLEDAKQENACGLVSKIGNMLKVALGGPKSLAVVGMLVAATVALGGALVPHRYQHQTFDVSRSVARTFAHLGIQGVGDTLLAAGTSFAKVLPGFELASNAMSGAAKTTRQTIVQASEMGKESVAPIIFEKYPEWFALHCLEAWQRRTADARDGIILYGNANDETGKQMLQMYNNEQTLLDNVKPLLKDLMEKAKTNKIDEGKSIIGLAVFADFLRHDLGFEATEHALIPNQEAMKLYSECVTLLDSAALTIAGVQQCLLKLNPTQLANLLQMRVGQLESERSDFDKRQQGKASSTLSAKRSAASNATTLEEYQNKDKYEDSRFAPIKIALGNGQVHNDMKQWIELMVEELEERERETNSDIIFKGGTDGFVNPTLFQDRDILREIAKFLKNAGSSADKQPTGNSRSNATSVKSQEAMIPVWAFLTWPIAIQLQFQEPIALAFSTIMGEAAAKSLRIKEFASSEPGKETALKALKAIPNLDQTDAEEALEILKQSTDAGRTEYVRVLQLTLRSAFKDFVPSEIAAQEMARRKQERAEQERAEQERAEQEKAEQEKALLADPGSKVPPLD